MTPDARLILREEELDASIELFVLAEAALWSTAEAALQDHPSGLGRGHYRAALLLKRRPGVGVQELAQLTAEGRAFEARVSERMRSHLARAYRSGGLDAVPGARRILAAVAGSRLQVGLGDGE